MGEGVGKDQGLVVFVEGALPGETVEVSLTEKKKRYGRGKLKSILHRSPHRIEPKCPVYSKCGGCQLMHLSYAEQLKAKTKRVQECLQKIGHCEILVNDCLPSPDEFHWRHKVQIPAAKMDGKTVFGFYERGTHNIVPISECLIHVESGNALLRKIEAEVNKLGISLRHVLLKSSSYSGKTLVILIAHARQKIEGLAKEIIKDETVAGVILNINTRDDNVILGPEFETLAGESTLIEELAGCQFMVSPASFFQVNPGQAERMYETIVEYADVNKKSAILDAYCGVGTMAIIMAKKAGRVLGIECVEEAVIDARKNAELNGVFNTKFRMGTLESIDLRGHTFDTVLLNPPRKGCEEKALQKIIQLKPKCIVYTSCDPATLSRDLAILMQSGYRIDKVQPFDMFPQTMHVETVVRITSR